MVQNLALMNAHPVLRRQESLLCAARMQKKTTKKKQNPRRKFAVELIWTPGIRRELALRKNKNLHKKSFGRPISTKTKRRNAGGENKNVAYGRDFFSPSR